MNCQLVSVGLMLALSAATAGAQGGTPITAAKNAATRSAATANARNAAAGEQSSAAAPVQGQPARQPSANAQPGASRSVSVAERGARGQMSFTRETFSYSAGGRRDPFLSLLKSGDLRPLFSDLRLVTIVYAGAGGQSVAVFRDQATKDQYRVRVGQTVGRMTIAAIRPREVVFTINEYGFSRQETLTYSDSTQVRKR